MGGIEKQVHIIKESIETKNIIIEGQTNKDGRLIKTSNIELNFQTYTKLEANRLILKQVQRLLKWNNFSPQTIKKSRYKDIIKGQGYSKFTKIASRSKKRFLTLNKPNKIHIKKSIIKFKIEAPCR